MTVIRYHHLHPTELLLLIGISSTIGFIFTQHFHEAGTWLTICVSNLHLDAGDGALLPYDHSTGE